MTQAKHTPGPWVLDGFDICADEGFNLHVIAQTSTPIVGDEKANAKLIAAAPDMLAEIEKQIEWLRHVMPQVTAPDSVMMGFEQSIKYLSAIAAKAKGEA